MNSTLETVSYSFQPQKQTVIEVNDRKPKYKKKDSETANLEEHCFQPFKKRIDQQINEERLLPDTYSVIRLALRIGLTHIEETEENAQKLLRKEWRRSGKEEKLRQSLEETVNDRLKQSSRKQLEELETEELHQLETILQKTQETKS